MEERHRDAIRRVFADVGQRLVVDKEFIIQFRTDDVITENMADEIMIAPTKLGKAYAFLDTITKRGPTAFPVLIAALNATGQSHIAAMIDPREEFSHVKPKLKSQPYPTARLTPSAPPVDSQNHGGRNTPPEDSSAFEKLTAMSADDLDRLKRDPDSIGAYRINDRGSRGRAVILSNEKFKARENREGSEFDVMNIDQLLQHFDYQTVQWKNLSAQEIKDKILDEAKKDAYKKSDSFIMVCLSHGNKGEIFGTDERPVNIEKDIVAPFDGNNCRHLIGKPKLFFIQACQGNVHTFGTIKADGDEVSDSVTSSMSQLDMDKPDAMKFEYSSSHEKADIFQFYATVPGYRAFRNTAKGSWFIHDLVKAICEHSHGKDIGRIATRVNHDINKRGTMNDGFKQMSLINSTLTKEFYFAK